MPYFFVLVSTKMFLHDALIDMSGIFASKLSSSPRKGSLVYFEFSRTRVNVPDHLNIDSKKTNDLKRPFLLFSISVISGD